MPLHSKEGPGIDDRGTLIVESYILDMIQRPYYKRLIYESQPILNGNLRIRTGIAP